MRRINDCLISKTPVFKSTDIDADTPQAEIKKRFYKYGYVTVPKVIDYNRVEALRNYLEDFFKAGKELNTNEFFLNPYLYTVPFEERIIKILKLLLGEEIVLYPNFTVRKNLFTDWHIDGAFIGKDDLLQSNNFKHVQCALYLQKNIEQIGGGLDVVPRSHNLLFKRFKNNNRVSNWLINYRNSHYEPASIDYELGDLIIFHSRLIHRGTQNTASGKLTNNKYGIFWSASKNDAGHVARHRNYFHKTYRETMELNQPNKGKDTLEQYKILKTQLRFKSVLDFKFPNDYPSDIRNIVSKQHLNIANL